MSEQNKALVQRFMDEVFKRRDPQLVHQFLSSDYVWHGPGGQDVRGPDGARQMMAMYFAAFPDLEITPQEMIAEGDKVVTRWTARGTHKGALLGAAPTGKPVTVSGVIISRVKDGKIVEEWEQFEELGMLQQIGLVPATAAAG